MDVKSFWEYLKKTYSLELFKETYKEWSDDRAMRLAAALAFYATTALAPLVTGILAIVGFVYSTEQAQRELIGQVSSLAGPQAAELVGTIVENASQPETARLAGIFSLLLLFWTASNVFVQLQDALDTVWGVQLRPDLGFVETTKRRFLPLLMVVGIGILLIVAVVINSALATVANLVPNIIPGMAFLWQALNFVISFAIITGLFGLIFNILPHVKIAWRDVWPGAALTALLFMIGQLVLGWYLSSQSGASVYGAAGSLIVLLLWLYYSAQIFLFGAEYTQVYATRYGRGVEPDEDAVGRDQVGVIKPAAQAANPYTPESSGKKHVQKAGDRTGQRPRQQVTQASRMDPSHVTWVTTRSASGEMTRSPREMQIRAASTWDLSYLSLGQLVDGLILDFQTLWAKEKALARAEISQTISRLARGAGLAAGGVFLAYAGVVVLLVALPILLLAFTVMPFWLSTLLVGLLVLIEGALLARWGMLKLSKLKVAPEQTIDSVREDVEVVKEHVTT